MECFVVKQRRQLDTLTVTILEAQCLDTALVKLGTVFVGLFFLAVIKDAVISGEEGENESGRAGRKTRMKHVEILMKGWRGKDKRQRIERVTLSKYYLRCAYWLSLFVLCLILLQSPSVVTV